MGELGLAWGNAREEVGTAKMNATINAASLKAMTEQLDRNQAIAERLDNRPTRRDHPGDDP